MHKYLFYIFVHLLVFAPFSYGQGAATANLRGWYKADLGTSTTTDNAQISTWTDQSVGGHDATQNGGSRPRYQDSSDGINFNPYVSYDGVNDFFNIPNSGDFNTSIQYQKSYSIVFRTGTDIITRQFLFEEGGGTRGLNIYINNGELYVAGWNRNNDGVGAPWNYLFDSEPVDQDSVYIATFILDGNATTTGTMTLNLNGQNEFTINNVGRLYSHGASNGLGAKDNASRIEPDNNSGGDGFYSSADIAEFVYFNAHSLTATQMNQLESYLAIKYGVTLDQTPTEDYLDYNANPIYHSTTTHSSYIYDIAGIGVDTLSSLNQPKSKSINDDSVLTMTDSAPFASNGEFLIWGNDNDDNGIIEEISTGVPVTITNRLDRVWRADETGDIGPVDIEFDVNGISVSGTTTSDFALLVRTADASFGTVGTTIIPATSYAGGIVTFAGVDFSGDDFFTLATLYTPSPPTVVLSSNNSSVPENGGISTITATLSNTWGSDVTVNLGFSGGAGFGTDYIMSGTTITVLSGNLTGSVNLTAQDDAFSEGVEPAVVDITGVTNGTEDGVQQITINITDDEPSNNACGGSERIFTTELTSGDVNVYLLDDDLPAIAGDDDTSFTTCTGGGACNRNFNYEMVVDSEANAIFMASYDDSRIFSVDISDLDNYNANTDVTDLYTGLPRQPFQIALHNEVLDTTGLPVVPAPDKVFWTEWDATNARILCADASGGGVITEIDNALNYPTGMEIDKARNRLYVNFGYDSPTRLDVYEGVLNADGSCNGTPTLTNIVTSGDNVDGIPGGDVWPLGFNLTIDPPGERLFFVDCNAQNIIEVNNILTPGTVAVDFSLYNITGSGTCFAAADAGRDIVYNKNTDELLWIKTNGQIDFATAAGGGAISTIVSNGTGNSTAFTDSRSIDICFDEVAPRLVSFTSTAIDGTYCPGDTINITATYDEAIKVGSTITVTLDTGIDVVLSTIVGNEISGTYTVGATGSGENSLDLTVFNIASESVSDISDNVATTSTVVDISGMNIENTSGIIVDTAAPVVTVVTPVATPTLDRTPDFTFNTDTAGTITYGGSCGSATTAASAGDNTITLGVAGTFANLPDGTYSDCTLTILETNGCNQTVLNIPTFTVAADIPEVTLTINDISIDESGTVLTGQAIVTATLSNVYALPITVNLAFSGTAEGSDYVASSTQIIIPALSTTGTITITSTTDTTDEDDETVIVDITTPLTNATEGTPNQVTTTIVDDDDPPSVTLTVDKTMIDESGSDGFATFTATLSALSEKNITVALSFSGDAVDADYSELLASIGTISINAGVLTGSITITPIDDTLFEEDEDVIVDINELSLVNVTEGTPNQATTTIKEDVICNGNPLTPPSGYTNRISISIDRTFAPVGPTSTIIPDGDYFDAYMNSLSDYSRSTNELRAKAVQYFSDQYGFDFSGGDVDPSGAVLLHHSYSTEGMNPGDDVSYQATINSATGYDIVSGGGELHAGIYYALIPPTIPTYTFLGLGVSPWIDAPGIDLPFGTVVQYGEYYLELHSNCSDGDTENYSSESIGSNSVYNSEGRLIAFQSKQPTLADFDAPSLYGGHSGSGIWLDIPEIFENDIIDPITADTYYYTGGEIRGTNELRQDPGTGDVDVLTTIVITE